MTLKSRDSFANWARLGQVGQLGPLGATGQSLPGLPGLSSCASWAWFARPAAAHTATTMAPPATTKPQWVKNKTGRSWPTGQSWPSLPGWATGQHLAKLAKLASLDKLGQVCKGIAPLKSDASGSSLLSQASCPTGSLKATKAARMEACTMPKMASGPPAQAPQALHAAKLKIKPFYC